MTRIWSLPAALFARGLPIPWLCPQGGHWRGIAGSFLIFGECPVGGDVRGAVKDVFDDVGDHQRPLEFCSHCVSHAIFNVVALESG